MADTIFDDAIKYGWRYGGSQTITVPATNADYINRRGSGFVKIVRGVARMCASKCASLSGWLIAPKETTHGNSVRLDGNEYAVITDPTAVFECPVDEKLASLTATKIGQGCHPITRGSTTSLTQKLRIPAGVGCATPLLLIQDVDVSTSGKHSVFVRINPAKMVIR